MPRPPRIDAPGSLFHVMARGNDGRKTFLDAQDYQAFFRALSEQKQKTPFLIYAFCLMPNHFHLLMETERFSLSVIMQRLLTRYVKRFNFRHQRVGHLFQGRYKAILCQKDSYLQELIRYVHLNPVRAKMVKEVSAWKWSSHREYLGEVKGELTDNRFPLSLFHKDIGSSRRYYARFVNEGVEMGHQEEFYPSPSTPCLGEESFVDDYRERIAEKTTTVTGEVKLIPLEKLVPGKAKVALALLRSSTQVRAVAVARREFVLNAVKMGHRPSLIAAFLNCSPSAISKIVTRSL
jgi:putative transposase